MGALALPFPLSGAGFITVGASAPLFGLFGALIVYGNRTGQTQQSRQVWRWVAMFVVIGLIVPIIDNWGHIGGLAGGLVAARIMDPLRPDSPSHMLIALACLVLTAASIVASVVLGLPFFLNPAA
jgi:rhomboid protease GluP